MTSLDLTDIEFPIEVTEPTARYWLALEADEFVVPRCNACDQWFFYPRMVCPSCGSRDVEYVPASGRGRIYSYCRHHQIALAHLTSLAPFVTVLVELAEGPRMLGLLDGEPRIGLPVEVEARPTRGAVTVPVFVPIAGRGEVQP